MHPRAKVVSAAELGESIDVLVVLGGDGTFLFGASLVADHGVALLGINLGSLGFMAHYTLPEARAAVEAARSGALPIEERMRLRVSVRSGGRRGRDPHGAQRRRHHPAGDRAPHRPRPPSSTAATSRPTRPTA